MNTAGRFATRRGALLLLVLSMLALFLMLGALMLMMATRSRTAARAFSNAAAAADSPQPRVLLDEALMIALRGSQDPAVMGQIKESILGDKYGVGAGSCTVSLAYSGSQPLLNASITGIPSQGLFGRVLTLKTTGTLANDDAFGLPVSFRIVGASGSTAYLANPLPRPRMPVKSGTYEAVVNGREFADVSSSTTGTTAAEPWDAADDSNYWLALPAFRSGTITSFRRLSFAGAGTATVDNDNDGVADGAWLSNILPSRPSPGGGTYDYKVSYLVLDLDGRININTCGSSADYGVSTFPRGMGYGPADVDVSGLLASPPAPPGVVREGGNACGPTAAASDIFKGILTGGSATRGNQRWPTPELVYGGRYGIDGKPRRVGDDQSRFQQTMTGTSPLFSTYPGSLYRLSIAGTNAVADLQGVAEVSMLFPPGQLMPTLQFAVTGTSQSTIPIEDRDGTDDPYEVRLDEFAPRATVAITGSNASNDDNPLAVADMERLLRGNDADASALPPRLAAVLGPIAEQSRMRITTDSWDTPALIGPAAAQVEAAFSGTTVGRLTYPWNNSNAASPDVAAGLRFNINRPVRSGTSPQAVAEQQEYCKGLYTLLLKLGYADQAEAAQWAANVLDFRDDDSTMTRFVYDTDLKDGWNLSSSGTVFGVERPDMVITETAGWWDASVGASGTGQLFVNLHRPAWSAEVIQSGSRSPREVLSADLRSGTNNLHIAKSVGNSAVWQLRFADDKVVQFSAITGGTSQQQHVLQSGSVSQKSVNVFGAAQAATALTSGTPGNFLCVHTAPPTKFAINVTGTHAVSAGGTAGFMPTKSGTMSVWLERLADPTRGNDAANPYVPVDRATVDVVALPAPLKKLVREQRPRKPEDLGDILANFWNNGQDSWKERPDATIRPEFMQRNDPIPWLHWPNRPFVSHAEMVLVPADGPEKFLEKYAFPPSSLVSNTTPITVSGSAFPFGQVLLDAVHVPSRFAGTSLTFTGTNSEALAPCGLDLLQAGQLSTWREPGKVNVNTLASGSTSIDAIVWSTLVSGTQLRLTAGGSTSRLVTSSTFQALPAKSTAQLLSLDGAPGQPMAAELVSANNSTPSPRENPFLAYATAIRLANTATIRSHVFAVWITLETTDTTDDSKTYHRLFAIVDRSIPVGFENGRNLNVRDTIRLQRFLE